MKPAPGEPNWPRFRGPGGMGIVPEGTWPREWDGAKGRNIAWKAPIRGKGKSSPVVWGDRIFLTFGDKKTQGVVCFNRHDGKELWRTVVPPPKRDWTGAVRVLAETGYAAPSPSVDEYAVYVTYASADTAALNHDGKILWSRNLGKPVSAYGLSSSLLIDGERLILQLDRGSNAADKLSALLAIDRKTGKTLWRKPRPVPNSWSTPVIAQVAGKRQLLTAAAPWIIAYDPKNGREIWRCKGLTGDVAPGPVAADGVVYVTTDYSQLLAIKADGTGDVSKTHVLWTADIGLSDASSPITDGSLFMQVNSEGLLTCYDAKSGKLFYEHELKGAFWASLTKVGDVVYLPSARGITHIFSFDKEFKLLQKNNLGEPVFASPVFVEGSIYLRGSDHLFRISAKTAK